MRNLTFNGIDFSTYQTFVDGSQLFDTPDKDVTFFSIPGKNGDLSISNDRFNNIEVSVNCFIRTNFIENYNNLINFLYSQEGYQRLEYSAETDIFRMASFVKAIQPDTGAFLKYGQFTLVFNCKPQKWLKTGEIDRRVTSSRVLNNPTLFDSKPLLVVTGTGTININDSELVLAQNTSQVYIDCELEDAYEGTINRNPDLTITNGFPRMKPGNNTITVTGCTVDVFGRWWRL